jgi:hypothetical protein
MAAGFSAEYGDRRCLRVQCINEGTVLQVQVNASDWITCPLDGGVVAAPSGFRGTVTCPAASQMCADKTLWNPPVLSPAPVIPSETVELTAVGSSIERRPLTPAPTEALPTEESTSTAEPDITAVGSSIERQPLIPSTTEADDTYLPGTYAVAPSIERRPATTAPFVTPPPLPALSPAPTPRPVTKRDKNPRTSKPATTPPGVDKGTRQAFQSPATPSPSRRQ